MALTMLLSFCSCSTVQQLSEEGNRNQKKEIRKLIDQLVFDENVEQDLKNLREIKKKKLPDDVPSDLLPINKQSKKLSKPNNKKIAAQFMP
jgi:hypothetical protein